MAAMDHQYMRQALELARRGLGTTWPNPMVGALVVKQGRVVGRGFHVRAGGPHAEVIALDQAGSAARGADLYVTLEPCSHFGKTPPCAPRVAAAGIKRVVSSMQDPNPRVSGRGFDMLRKAGVKVEVGMMAPEARELNRVFIKKVTTGLPFVICKAALSLDGKLACATGVSRWISGLPSRKYAHRLRSMADAVVIGMGTLLQDNPRLDARGVRVRADKPRYRVVLAGKRRLPRNLNWLAPDTGRAVLAAGGKNPIAPRNSPGLSDLEVWQLPDKNGRVDLGKLLRRLGAEGASLVLVEGGAEVHASFLGLQSRSGKVWADEVQFILAPKLIGGRMAPGAVGGEGASRPDRAIRLRQVRWEPLGADMLVTAKPYKP